jgi:hypothetical protein
VKTTTKWIVGLVLSFCWVGLVLALIGAAGQYYHASIRNRVAYAGHRGTYRL